MIGVALAFVCVAQDTAGRPTLSPMFGSFVLAAGDVDGDGKDDFVIGDEGWEPSGSPAAFWVLSGATGREIHAFHAPDLGGDFPHRVHAAGDVDRDRCADLWLILPPSGEKGEMRVVLWSGKTRAVARAASSDEYGAALRRAHEGRPFGDLDGDGVDDRVEHVGNSQVVAVEIRSAKDDAVLWQVEMTSTELILFDDVDRDGRRDVLCIDYRWGVAQGQVELRSGRDCTLLWRAEDGDYWYFGWSVDVLEDLDGDGVRDWIVGGSNHRSHEHGQASIRDGATGSELASFCRNERGIRSSGFIYRNRPGTT